MAKVEPLTVLEIAAWPEGEELILDEAPFERRYLADDAPLPAIGERMQITDERHGKVTGTVYYVGKPNIIGKGGQARRVITVTMTWNRPRGI